MLAAGTVAAAVAATVYYSSLRYAEEQRVGEILDTVLRHCCICEILKMVPTLFDAASQMDLEECLKCYSIICKLRFTFYNLFSHYKTSGRQNYSANST